MRVRSLYSWGIATMISGLLFQASFIDDIAAQTRSGSPTPWTRETRIVRPPKPGGHQPRIVIAPLLTLEWEVLKQAENGLPEPTSPSAIFYNEDRLQLRIKTNQKGYLHIIQNHEGLDGELIFPDSRINNGQHFVGKNEEIVVPPRCEPKYMDNNGRCWFGVSGPAGRAVFTVIFSREAIPETITRINMSGGVVKREDIDSIKESPQRVTSQPQGGGASGYALWVTNTDRRNNEELVARITLNTKERRDGQ